MGDGSIASYGIKIGTDSFSVKECVLLINVLIIKYNINCTILMNNNNKPRIYIKAESKNRLISLIKPYLVPSMYYKLGLTNNNSVDTDGIIKSILEETFSILNLANENKINDNYLISIIIGSVLGSCEIIKVENNFYIVVNKNNSNEKNSLLLLYNNLAKLGYCKNIKPNSKFMFLRNNKTHYNFFKFFINLN